MAVETIKVALDAGFVDYDTAPHYGLGLSEERLGKGLKAHANGRPFRVWTKNRVRGRCGSKWLTCRMGVRAQQTGRIMKNVSDVKEEDKIEFGNVPGTPGCIFVEADLNLRPVLDYTGAGMRMVCAK
eukprot:4903810-Pyramimonas_sp.AAC.3